MTKRYPFLLALLATLTLACGTGSADGGQEPHDHKHGGDGEHDHYQPGMTRTSEQELYSIAFYSDPGPPAVGLNVFRLGIADAAGTAVEGALVTVDLSMPGHGHGSDRNPVVEEEAAGVYRVEQASLTMLGIWQIDVTIEAEAGTDTVSFRFDVL